MKFRAPLGRILFKFVDDLAGGSFKNKTEWGFEFRVETDEIKHPRWGEVTHVAEDITSVKIGDYILIEPLMWTIGFDVGSEQGAFWQTSEEKVWAVTDTLPKP